VMNDMPLLQELIHRGYVDSLQVFFLFLTQSVAAAASTNATTTTHSFQSTFCLSIPY
jgi:hypothetical protein